MKCELKNICQYRVGKVLVNTLDNKNYVSTENMLPDKRGIQPATSMPNIAVTQRYCVGDVLVSNIRPYFKKIYFAKNDGGCSNDVLVFQPLNNVEPQYLYYVLANDEFFAYCTASSNGTKMPRGDKGAIMQYKVNLPDLKTQKKIAKVLSALDDKIELNNQINKNLEEQAQALYKSWFIDFEPFGRRRPTSWYMGILSDLANISTGKRPTIKSDIKTSEFCIPIVGASSVMGYTSKSNYNDRILVTGRVGTHGVIQRFSTACWASDNTLVITSNYYEYVNQILGRIDYSSLNRGSTQPLITQGDMNKESVLIPDTETLDRFETIVGGLMTNYDYNNNENMRLEAVRDTLLPKLMSGEIDVDNVEI